MSDEVAITLITSLTGVLSTVLTIGIRRIGQHTQAIDKLIGHVLQLRAALERD